jgi:hypothetical protein
MLRLEEPLSFQLVGLLAQPIQKCIFHKTILESKA